MTGPKCEAGTGVAVLDDIEEDIMTALCHFAYSGRYDMPVLNNPITPLPYRPESVEAKRIFGDDDNREELRVCSGFTSSSQPFYSMFDQYMSSSLIEHLEDPLVFKYADMTNAFLHHAKMYILGDRYDIKSLRVFALCHLAHCLSHFRDTWDAIPSFVALVKQIYGWTREDDRVRELLSKCAAAQYRDYVHHPDVCKVLKECPDFCFDVLRHSTGESGV